MRFKVLRVFIALPLSLLLLLSLIHVAIGHNNIFTTTMALIKTVDLNQNHAPQQHDIDAKKDVKDYKKHRHNEEDRRRIGSPLANSSTSLVSSPTVTTVKSLLSCSSKDAC